MRMLTLSLPGALLVGMDIMMFLTSEQETGSKLNISDVGIPPLDPVA
jgi:hypothetical protein